MTREGRFSSHLRLLVRALQLTTGPVLELGTGAFSTPVLHWLCYPSRRLVSYESDRRYFDKFRGLASEFHEVAFVEDWDRADVDQPWDVVLVDHTVDRRRIELARVAAAAKFVVVHDTEAGRAAQVYRMGPELAQYQYRYDFAPPLAPATTVVSNQVPNLAELFRA